MKQTCFMSKPTSVPQTPQTNQSQFSSPVEALNLIVESKSQPVELDNHNYCSVEFEFLSLMRFDMTFDVTLSGDSSFVKLTNSCN